MAKFIEATVSDMKGGRESWRVLLALTVPSFAVAVAFVALTSLQ